jgi:endonuclease YncB( thermonuclease family)
MRYIFVVSIGTVLSAIVAMLVFLYIDSAKQLDKTNISTESNNSPPERSKVVEIIDGSTIKLASGHKVRYLGVRMPNVRQRIECFGKEALAMNESVIGKTVRLESDPVLERAEDGAWLRYVYTPKVKEEKVLDDKPTNGSDVLLNDAIDTDDNNNSVVADDIPAISYTEPDIGVNNEEDEYMINEQIIETGVGFPLLSEEMTYFDRMASGMKYSRATEKGLWGKCEIDTPEGGPPRTNVVEECIIKGKVLINGDKVYREPGCTAYANTVVLQYSKGDLWLCSKEEAEESGWQRAKDC